ncbi:aminodeoxychorismate synthase component I [Arsenicicoccus dermatophilus]|uniref:aminodeoxychorismate synthase component I n=1 Tax=Arsenicicoccus dermatophilus TaxID=1076331 RepID=UPI00391735EB
MSAPEAFRALFGAEPVAAWLDSARCEGGLARWSYLGAPGPTGEVLSYRVGSGQVLVSTDGRMPEGGTRDLAAGDADVRGGVTCEGGTIVDALRRRLAPAVGAASSSPESAVGAGRPPGEGLPAEADPGAELPFDLVDGWIGYLGYELKGDLGAVNRHTSHRPDAVWLRCERLLVLDHETGRAWLVGHGAGAAAWVARAREVLRDLAAHGPTRSAPRPQSEDATGVRTAGVEPQGAGPQGGRRRASPQHDAPGDVRLARDTDTYRADVAACLEALRRGESYEICLTDTVLTSCAGDPFAAYLRLRELNPAPHAAYLRLGDTHVLSASPELFLRVGRDGWVETKPIKGTAPRHADPVEDARAAADLAADAKTRAENLMIADLLRNDLSRVCDPGTVQVPALMAVESYATVHQLVTTVRARIAPGRTGIDAVEACFPGGSMTGAPKHRTMEIIDGLETRARGIYSGALGLVDRSGALDLSVVIRTAVVEDGEAEIGAGGAIVLDSDPDAETEEMLLKARSVLPALAD